jgi:hypothetical protein
LKQLSKKDENTKIKALNNLQNRVQTLSSEEAGEFLPSWLFTFKKVCTDNCRGVRAGGAKVLALIVQKAGRNTAPHLKELLGPLCLAMQDIYPEARELAIGLFNVRKPTSFYCYCPAGTSWWHPKAAFVHTIVSVSPDVLFELRLGSRGGV